MPTETAIRFTDPRAARRYLQDLLWQLGPACPHCKIAGRSTALKGKSTRPGVFWCNECRKPFSVTVGTVLEGSKVPLNLWLHANHLLCRESGMSGQQLARKLGVSYKTAWFMARHIRRAMDANSES